MMTDGSEHYIYTLAKLLATFWVRKGSVIVLAMVGIIDCISYYHFIDCFRELTTERKGCGAHCWHNNSGLKLAGISCLLFISDSSSLNCL
jgi:hypothetical protein